MRHAILDANSVIQNVAEWDGVQPWEHSTNAKNISNRIGLGVGKTYTEHPGIFTYNIVIDGNSIAAAYSSNSNCIENGIIDAGLQQSDIFNVAISGRTTRQLITGALAKVDAVYLPSLGDKNICIFWEISNDLALFPSWTAEQAFAAVKSYCVSRKAVGWKVVVATCLPRIGQGIDTVDIEERRLGVNQYIRDAFAGGEDWVDAVADVGADPIMGNVSTCSNKSYYPDGTHPTVLGHSLCRIYFKETLASLF
jgi:hypothetical protein